MSKLIKINDRKPIELYIGRKTRGPINAVRVTEDVIGRILRSIDAPKDIYAIGPNNSLVRLTLENYMKSEEELFNIVKDEEVSNIDKVKVEAIKKSLEAKKNNESKNEELKVNQSELVTQDSFDTLKDENGEEVKVQEGDLNDKPSEILPEETTVKEVVVEKKEAPVKNNYNNNYNHNKNYNKNRK